MHVIGNGQVGVAAGSCLGDPSSRTRPNALEEAVLSGKVERTVDGALSKALVIDSHIDTRYGALTILAERAVQLAMKLGGPYGTSADKGEAELPPDGMAVSAVDAVHRRLDIILPKVAELGRPARTISEALDAIERAIG